MKDSNIEIHFIEVGSSEVFSHKVVSTVPRVGDEVRFGSQWQERFFKITKVVWCYDEEVYHYHRANIEIEEIDLSKTGEAG